MSTISNDLSDDAILHEIGSRLARRRLDLGLTQAALAEASGVSKSTVERVEAGASAQLSSVVRMLRGLELLPGLDALLPEPGPRPMDLLRLRGRERRRAYSPRSAIPKVDSASGSGAAPSTSRHPWTWGEDT